MNPDGTGHRTGTVYFDGKWITEKQFAKEVAKDCDSYFAKNRIKVAAFNVFSSHCTDQRLRSPYPGVFK